MIFSTEISISTKGSTDVIDITGEVENILKKSKVMEGLVTVSMPGSTGAITTIEYEPGVINDLKDALDAIAPRDKEYAHDAKWGDGNGYSHIRSALVGTSKSFPVAGGRVSLGTWQQIVFIDFDNRPRQRKIIVQVLGEKA